MPTLPWENVTRADRSSLGYCVSPVGQEPQIRWGGAEVYTSGLSGPDQSLEVATGALEA